MVVSSTLLTTSAKKCSKQNASRYFRWSRDPYFYYRIYALLIAFHIVFCLLLQYSNAHSVYVPLDVWRSMTSNSVPPPSKFPLSHLRGSSHGL